MRKQYYFRTSAAGLLAWDVDRLVELTRDSPRKQVPLSEIRELDQAMKELAEQARWKPIVEAMRKEKGVGLITALKYSTDIGDFARFRRGRQVGAFYGLTPASDESGEINDRKGHITREGSPSGRQVLCQSTWSRVRHDPHEREVYQRLVLKNPKKKKIALVACMRRLTVKLWHVGFEAQLKMKAEAAQK